MGKFSGFNQRLKTASQRFWEKVNKDGPIPEHRPKLGKCWVWVGARTTEVPPGYGRIYVAPKVMVAHRYSWEIHFGAIGDGLSILHKCDNRGCVRPSHLFPGTQLDNIDDMFEKGRNPKDCRPRRGEDNCSAKLTEAKVLEIRKRFSAGDKINKIAKDFDITDVNAGFICKRKTWTHL